MYKRKFNADGIYSSNKTLRMVNAGGGRSTSLRRGTMRRYKRSTKSVKDLVKSAISRNQEKKESNVYSLNHPLGSPQASGWVASSIRLSPGTNGFSIPNGTGQGNRIGNKIRVEKAWFKGIISPMQFDATTNGQPSPMQIRMILLKDKFRATSQPAAIGLDLFQSGSTSLGPSNDLVDQIMDINQDRYQVYHEQRMKLGFAENTGTGSNAAWGHFANNDFQFNCEFAVDITKYLPKNIVFNDAEVEPMSDGLWAVFLLSDARGGMISNVTVPATLQYSANIEYTDA